MGWGCYNALILQQQSINLNYILVSIANKTDFSFKHVIRIHMYFENDVDFNQMGTVFCRIHGHNLFSLCRCVRVSTFQMCDTYSENLKLKNIWQYMYIWIGNKIKSEDIHIQIQMSNMIMQHCNFICIKQDFTPWDIASDEIMIVYMRSDHLSLTISDFRAFKKKKYQNEKWASG